MLFASGRTLSRRLVRVLGIALQKRQTSNGILYYCALYEHIVQCTIIHVHFVILLFAAVHASRRFPSGVTGPLLGLRSPALRKKLTDLRRRLLLASDFKMFTTKNVAGFLQPGC